MRHPIHPDAAPPAPNLAQGVVPEAELPVVSAFAPDDAEHAPLTSRREMFCRVYVACGNAAEAARRAGYAEGSARQQGWRLLEDDAVRDRIEALWHLADRVRETDRDLILDAAGRLFEESMAAKSFNAAARALVLQARLAGFLGPARDREPVTPGRPGPMARAAQRQAERSRAERSRAERRQAAQCQAERLQAKGCRAEGREVEGPRAEAGAGKETEAGADGRPDAADTEARPRGGAACADAGGAWPPAAAANAAATATATAVTEDPWSAASRIARQRKLAGVHSALAAVRRRQDLVSRARLAARDAAEGPVSEPCGRAA